MAVSRDGIFVSNRRRKKTRQGNGRGTKFSTRAGSKRFKKKKRGQGWKTKKRWLKITKHACTTWDHLVLIGKWFIKSVGAKIVYVEKTNVIVKRYIIRRKVCYFLMEQKVLDFIENYLYIKKIK